MKALVAFLSAALIGATSLASTFVGNGGNAGDIEATVAFKQIRDTLEVIVGTDPKTSRLCRCEKLYANRPICEPLESLTDKQDAYCTKFLHDRASELVKLLSGEGRIRIVWTNEKIEVAEHGGLRGADAVANREKGVITVNQKRFLRLSPADRIFLLTHEMMHFTDWDGKPLTDEGAIGPFEGGDGARRLLNAASSATAIQAFRSDFITKYSPQLNRSQSSKRFWFDVNGGRTHPEMDKTSTFSMQKRRRSEQSFRYYIGTWGVVLNHKGYSADKTVLSSIQANEEGDSYGVGVAYRFFPFEDPLTYWGQSHLAVQFLVEHLSMKYTIDDGSVRAEYDAKTWGSSLGAVYYLPVIWNFWLHVGGSFDMHKYEYSRINVKYGNNNVSSYFGVSYAF